MNLNQNLEIFLQLLLLTPVVQAGYGRTVWM